MCSKFQTMLQLFSSLSFTVFATETMIISYTKPTIGNCSRNTIFREYIYRIFWHKLCINCCDEFILAYSKHQKNLHRKKYALINYRYFRNTNKIKTFLNINKFFRALSLNGKSCVWWLLEFNPYGSFSFFRWGDCMSLNFPLIL